MYPQSRYFRNVALSIAAASLAYFSTDFPSQYPTHHCGNCAGHLHPTGLCQGAEEAHYSIDAILAETSFIYLSPNKLG